MGHVNVGEDLTIAHCKQVLDTETLIGSGRAKDGFFKKFTYNMWQNEYRVWHYTAQVDGGQAIEELLEFYNNL